MKKLPPPGPGDNFYTVCKNCGTITYTNKSSAETCQPNDVDKKRKCNPKFNKRKKPSYCKTIITCFKEEVNVDECIDVYYNEYAQNGQTWGDPIAAPFLVMCCQYHGPLPQGQEMVIVGSYVIRKVRMPKCKRVGYQFKPYLWLTYDERDVWQNTIVKGEVTLFYKSQREHPLHEAKMDAEALDLLERDYDDFLKRRARLNGEE